jgi:hypothetical protein
MKDKRVVLYHAYGLKELYLQVAFSVLTLFDKLGNANDSVQCIVYTDNECAFKKLLPGLPIVYEHLSREKIQSYRGEFDFVHRLKIFVIKDCLTKYKSKVLYMDADTFFLKSTQYLFDRISAEHVIMNYDGYNMIEAGNSEEGSWLLMRKILREKTFEIGGGKVKIPLTARMWNAGVIGVDYQQLTILDQVISLTDQIYAHQPVFTAEQFAFSYIFQTNFSISPTEDYLVHYWPKVQKKILNYHFKLFFRQNKGAPLELLLLKARTLAEEWEELQLPDPTLLDRLLLRLKLVREVALKGRISSN